MPLSFQVEGADKDQLVTALAAILLQDCGAEITSESIESVVTASGAARVVLSIVHPLFHPFPANYSTDQPHFSVLYHILLMKFRLL